jgi:phospholipid transport system transporter-binding protein
MPPFQPGRSLTVHSASAVLAAGLQAISAGQTVFDLSGVAELDSAAVATLLAWQRAALACGNALTFTRLPANLCSLMHLYGVAELLLPAAKADSRHH